MQGINAEPFTSVVKIVMDSVMDFSVFEASITPFKYLYISMLMHTGGTNRDG